MKKGWLYGWKEIAEYIGCSVRQVNYYAERDGLPFRKIGSKCLAYPTDIDEWIKNKHISGRFNRNTS